MSRPYPSSYICLFRSIAAAAALMLAVGNSWLHQLNHFAGVKPESCQHQWHCGGHSCTSHTYEKLMCELVADDSANGGDFDSGDCPICQYGNQKFAGASIFRTAALSINDDLDAVSIFFAHQLNNIFLRNRGPPV